VSRRLAICTRVESHLRALAWYRSRVYGLPVPWQTETQTICSNSLVYYHIRTNGAALSGSSLVAQSARIMREARVRVRLTQGDLGNSTSLKQRYISLAESGTRNMTFETADVIAPAIGLDGVAHAEAGQRATMKIVCPGEISAEDR